MSKPRQLDCKVSGVKRVVDEVSHVLIELDSGGRHRILKQPGYSIDELARLAKSIEAHNAAVTQRQT